LVDLSNDDFARILSLGAEIKQSPNDFRSKLAGKAVAMVFAKPSTRTRVSFEVGIQQLGAQPVFLPEGGPGGLQTRRGESQHDTALVLSRYVDAIVIRTFEQRHVDALAEHGDVPVINALTDTYHPCQALADAMTMAEKLGELRGRKVVYVGAGNNVAHSLMLAGPRAGYDFVCACPASLLPDAEVVKRAERDAAAAGTKVSLSHDLAAAVDGASVVYTDTWVSMGQESDSGALEEQLEDYQVTDEVMARGADDAIFMHCLPAHRGVEVTGAVMDGPRSVVFDQAENRLHAQKALLLLLLEAAAWS
jgi:ornithine carbamoyltransferase